MYTGKVTASQAGPTEHRSPYPQPWQLRITYMALYVHLRVTRRQPSTRSGRRPQEISHNNIIITDSIVSNSALSHLQSDRCDLTRSGHSGVYMRIHVRIHVQQIHTTSCTIASQTGDIVTHGSNTICIVLPCHSIMHVLYVAIDIYIYVETLFTSDYMVCMHNLFWLVIPQGG